ncbi:hypothetical protein ISF_06992 [Cordyceps fumosorosea ARSEF 2679]|uniref:Uncharacterized protein n=1 Tax=Cordyceps fumosorosea (strain ARSEF 2679) TaxID=1081104 RepID=A0A167QLL8_CORFA|nr:hypothetical protein ISF_06992 [Cordyceps fumosorosea ARSEF 2679]OAA57751.1 hypothetical protein ISF_06992 [Cordyceps fumosorosea ARSEF 2679]
MADSSEMDELQPSIEFLRLRWQITDGLAFACVHAIADPEDASSAQQPLQAADGTFHEIAGAPCSDPPTARLTLQMEEATYLGVDGDVSSPDATAARLEIAAAPGEDHVTIRQYVTSAHAWLLAQRQKHFEGYGYSADGGQQALPAEAELWFDPSSPNVINFFDSVESEPPFAFEWGLVSDMATGIIHGHPEDESDYGDGEEGPIDPIEELK